jgi:stress-induced morphogen
MPITPEVIRSRILAILPEATVMVRDSTGGGDHFDASVISAAFEGKSLIERHRMIYAALGDSMRTEIHALALETRTPAENLRNDPRNKESNAR